MSKRARAPSIREMGMPRTSGCPLSLVAQIVVESGSPDCWEIISLAHELGACASKIVWSFVCSFIRHNDNNCYEASLRIDLDQ
jgi:hypothetical protein